MSVREAERFLTLDDAVFVWRNGVIDDAGEREGLRVYLADWFQRNGVDPNTVALDYVCIAKGRVYFNKYLLNENGCKYQDDYGNVATEDTSHPISVPFGK